MTTEPEPRDLKLYHTQDLDIHVLLEKTSGICAVLKDILQSDTTK
jgi:hypothetical protein